MTLRMAITAAMFIAVPAGAAPRFIPSPKQAFEEFVALNAPRPEVPVGALWIDGYGPNGPGAAPDNLETTRSLTGMVIDNNLQLSLTAGLFDFIGIEPRFRKHYSARFTDLSIVKVKDVTKLTGPPGEPRIIEAIKAGSVTITSDGEVGLNARTGFEIAGSEASATNSRTHNNSIEGRDLFVAVRVATLKIVRSPTREILLRGSTEAGSGMIDDFEIRVTSVPCRSASIDGACAVSVSATVAKLSTWPPEDGTQAVSFGFDFKAVVALPVPISDKRGGLFDSLVLQWHPGCAQSKTEGCGKQARLTAQYEGRRLDDLKSPDMVRW